MTDRLSDTGRGPLLEPLLATGWHIEEARDALSKTFTFEDLPEAFAFMTRTTIWT